MRTRLVFLWLAMLLLLAACASQVLPHDWNEPRRDPDPTVDPTKTPTGNPWEEAEDEHVSGPSSAMPEALDAGVGAADGG